VAELNEARSSHTATLLPDGRVLVAGGLQNDWDDDDENERRVLASVELFDPATEAWSPGPAMHTRREEHSATLLRDGRVLVVGGHNAAGGYRVLASAEVFDPGTNVWTPLGDSIGASGRNSATLLSDGRVLVVGTTQPGDRFPQAATIFDPATGNWSPVARERRVLVGHVAIALGDGTVLVAGGAELQEGPPNAASVALIYDPQADEWISVGPMASPVHTATAARLPDGRIILAAAEGMAQIFDPGSRTWSRADRPLADDWGGKGVVLADGRLVVFGEDDEAEPSIPLVEVYDAIEDAWTTTTTFRFTRDQTTTLLPDGRVLVAGGYWNCHFGEACTNSETLADTLLFDPAGAP
jgi:N-acetylneuraminic acid mutarotase